MSFSLALGGAVGPRIDEIALGTCVLGARDGGGNGAGGMQDVADGLDFGGSITCPEM